MSVRRGLALMFGGNAAGFAIQFAASLAIARLLSPQEMGIYAAAMAVVWIVNGVLNVGLQSYVVRERELPPAKLGSVFTLALAQSALLGGGLLLGAPLVGALAHDGRVTQSVRLLAWFGALDPFLALGWGLMQRRMRFGRVVATSLVNVGVSAAATIALASIGYGWRSMPLGTGAGITAAVLLTLVLQRRDFASARPNLAHLGPVLKFGTRMMTAGLIQNLTGRAPDLLLTRASGAASTGLYNRGANLVDTLGNTVMQSVQRVMASQMARDRDTAVGIGPVYARMSRLVTGLFWPAFALLAVLARPIVVLLFGARWLPAAPVLAIVAAAAAINLAVACRSGVLVTAGRERELPRNEAIRGVIGVTLFTIAAYSGGLVWAAATRIVDALIAVALYSPGIHAATGLGWTAMSRAFARSALVAGATALPALAAMAALGWPATLPPLELVALLALSGGVWLGALFGTRHALADEIVRALPRPGFGAVG